MFKQCFFSTGYLFQFSSGYHYANNLVKEYPEAQKIVDVFKKYETDKIAEMVAQSCKRKCLFKCNMIIINPLFFYSASL